MKEFIKGLFSKPAYLLIVLGLGALLLAAAGKVEIRGQAIAVADPVWRIVVAAVGVLLMVASLALIIRDLRNPRPARPFKLQYDVFLATPMAALADEAAFKAQRQEALAIKEALRAHSGTEKIYDAGDKLLAGKWDPTDLAAEVDLEALRHSRYFLLIYPERLASSVLFEAGYALGMGKPAVYVVRDAKTLPYLMQELNNLSRGYPQVRIWECNDTAAIVERVRQTGTRMFTGDAPPPDC